MPAAESNNPEEPVGMADVNETNVADNAAAAPPVPPAAEAAGGGGGDNNVHQDNNNNNAMMDLSPYFNTLIDTLHRNNDTQNNAAGGDTNNAPQLRSMMVALLWNGVELIANAGRAASFGSQQQQQGGGGALFAVDTIGSSDSTNAASSSSVLPSKFAAVYLYAVAQNIIALEEVVLQGQGFAVASGSAGMVMDVLDGGVSIKQVAEIVSVSFVS